MKTISLVPVSDEPSISRMVALAEKIWREYYVPLIGQAQVDYMLDRFQSLEAVQEQISQGYFYYSILNADGRDIGYLALVANPGETYLSKLYLDAENRGKNFGRQALDFIKQWAKQRGLSRISLSVNKQNPSVQIYQKLGFRIVEPMVTDIGGGFFLDDYRMVMEI